jgi:hypothetical protein
LNNLVSGFQAVEPEPAAQPETVKKVLVAQAGKAVHPYRQDAGATKNFLKQSCMGL